MGLPSPSADRTCLVTGASSGIGAEIARRLAERGWGITLVARREDRLRALADELASAHGVRTEVVAADLNDVDARAGLPDVVAERGLTIAGLVNNAGFSTMNPVAASDPEREIGMVRTNVEAVVHLCSLVVPTLVEQGAGAVLNVASTAAFQPMPGQAGYAASKAFVLSYTQALSAELRGTGVTATALCPGPVETEFADVAGLDGEQAGQALPSFMWVSAEDVATAAVDGMQKGRGVVIPGTANRITASFAPITPKSILLPLIAKNHPALKRR